MLPRANRLRFEATPVSSKPISVAGSGAIMLEVRDLHVYYGVIHALKGVSFAIARGEMVTLLGANGAGKTTTLNTISGLLRPKGGAVELEGEPLDKMEPHAIVRLGISHVP